jgi:hypothetical protein
MEIPAPVNLSALQGILAKSKQVMNKVEGDAPVKQSRNRIDEAYQTEDSYGYDERDEREPIYEDYTPVSDPTQVTDYTEEQVRASNLPPAVKEAMLKNRIPRINGMASGVSAEDISRITGAPIRQQKPTINETQQRQPQKNNSDMITVSKTELKEMINEGISTFFKQVYDKTLTEETIKKTINLLIKEGKIGVKKKQI